MFNTRPEVRSTTALIFKCLLLAVFAWTCVMAHADEFAFNSGPPNQQGGNEMGDTVQFDAFTLSATTTLTGFRFWSLEGAGQYAGYINYVLLPDCGGGLGPSCSGFGGTIATPTRSATGLMDASNQFSEYVNTFGVNITLGPGTYWLGLANGNGSAFADVYWEWTDPNGGPGGWEYDLVAGAYNQNFSDHAFEALTTPEPGSLALLGSGLLGLGGIARRRWMK